MNFFSKTRCTPETTIRNHAALQFFHNKCNMAETHYIKMFKIGKWFLTISSERTFSMLDKNRSDRFFLKMSLQTNFKVC